MVLKKLKQIEKAKYWDYFILASRVLIGWTFLRYGYGKITGTQFGLNDQELITPIQDLDTFRLSWYLFDLQPFKSLVGFFQLISGVLLLWNRTAILGAFLFLPIVTTILIMDITFMPLTMAKAFTWRLSYYIVLDLLILWHYKERMVIIWDAVWNGVNTKYKYPFWVYLTLPFMAIIMEVLSPGIIFNILSNPKEFIEGLGPALQLLVEAAFAIFS